MPILRNNERIILNCKASCNEGQGLVPVGGTYQDKYKSVKGLLVLTNYRIIFEYSRGLLSKRHGTLFEIPLKDLKQIFVEKRVLKDAFVLEYKLGNSLQKYRIKVDNPNLWELSTRNAISKLDFCK